MNLNLVGYYTYKDIAFDTYRTFRKGSVAGIFTLMNTFRLPWNLQLELNGSYATRRQGELTKSCTPAVMLTWLPEDHSLKNVCL